MIVSVTIVVDVPEVQTIIDGERWVEAQDPKFWGDQINNGNYSTRIDNLEDK